MRGVDKSKKLIGSSGRTRSLPRLPNLLKKRKLLKTCTERFRLFRRFRLLHTFLGQFLGQKMLEAVTRLAVHLLSDRVTAMRIFCFISRIANKVALTPLIRPSTIREPLGLHANWLTNRKPMPSGPALLWEHEIDWLHYANSELPFERHLKLWKPVALPVHSPGSHPLQRTHRKRFRLH